MAPEHKITEIADDRPLFDEERALVQGMSEHGNRRAPSFLTQLSQARVAGRCLCGCASINFSVAGKRPSVAGMDILSDYDWEDADGHKFGAFVFARSGLLAGLDLYSIDGAVTPTWLPKPGQLHPSVFATQEV